MNNFTSMMIAILEKVELLTETEAKALAKELNQSTLPDNYEAAALMVDELFKKLEIKTLSSKVKNIKI